MIRAVAFAMTLCAASTAGAFPSLFASAEPQTPHPAVVRIVAPEKDGTSYGSGALVAVTESTGLVVTNWHVVRDAAGQVFVVFPDGFRSPANVLRTDRDWDLAALVIWRPSAQPMAVSNIAPRPGDMLTIAGYGSGSYRAVSGQCTQYVSPGGNQPFEMIEMSAPARNGDSGGPIIDQRGELAGVLFGSAFGRTTGSYCGRLRWFLTPVEGDFRRISSEALLAMQNRNNPVTAAISPRPMGEGPGVRAESAISTFPSVDKYGVRAEGVVAAAQPYAGSYSTLPPAPIGVQKAVAPVAAIPVAQKGPLPTTDQIKTILAAIGIIAVLYNALRLMGRAVG